MLEAVEVDLSYHQVRLQGLHVCRHVRTENQPVVILVGLGGGNEGQVPALERSASHTGDGREIGRHAVPLPQAMHPSRS
eukprot:103866-Hanusia_phi.AAC.2